MKHYFIGTILAVIVGAIATGIFWVLQWISWWIVFILAVLCFIPLTSFLVRCVDEYACCDFRDFVWAFKQEINPISESKKESENNNRIM